MNEVDPVLTDPEIRERLAGLPEPGVDDAERARFAQFLFEYQRGPAAEDALKAVIDTLSDAHLEPLVRKYVMADQALGNVAYCSDEWTDVLAARLVERGFEPVDRERGAWRVGWMGGGTLEGEQLCRVALLAEWLRKMSGLPGV